MGAIDTATLCAASIAGRGRGVPDRRGPGHRRHGLRDRQCGRRRRHRRSGQRLRRRGQAPIVRRRRSGVRLRRSVGDRGRRRSRRPAGLRRRGSRGAGRARAGRVGLAGDVGRRAGRGDRRRGRPHRRRIEPARRSGGHAGLGRDRLPGRRAGAGTGRRQRRRPRASAVDGARGRGAGPPGPGAERRGRLHRDMVAGQHGGLHRRAESRVADQPDGALRLGIARRRLPQARARGAGHAGRRCVRSVLSSSHWPRPRVCRRTPTRCASASTRSSARRARRRAGAS